MKRLIWWASVPFMLVFFTACNCVYAITTFAYSCSVALDAALHVIGMRYEMWSCGYPKHVLHNCPYKTTIWAEIKQSFLSVWR